MSPQTFERRQDGRRSHEAAKRRVSQWRVSAESYASYIASSADGP